MKEKTRNFLKWTPSLLTASIILLVGSMKIALIPQLVEIYSKIGLKPYMQILGVTELLLAALFLWPRTMKIGFLLLTAYYGGAMAVELSHGSVFVVPSIILTIIWIAAYMRDPGLFTYRRQNNLSSITAH